MNRPAPTSTQSPRAPLPLPSFYDPVHADRFDYRADPARVLAAAEEFRSAHAILPAQADSKEVHLLWIDVQKDFCFPEGSLFVAGRSGRGAQDDNRRLTEFLYRNLAGISRVTATLDTHFPFQIFFPSFWCDSDGGPVSPFRTVSVDDLDSGRVQVRPAVATWLCDGNLTWLHRQVRHYCQTLEERGKYQLYLWPHHCLLGSPGHSLAGVLEEARLFHGFVRQIQPELEIKGGHVLTENYSVLSPEVLSRHDGPALAGRNTHLIETLLRADRLIIAGQAASHCVKSTLDDLAEEIHALDPALARRVYVLTDCMSAVTVSDGSGGFLEDFTPQTEAALDRFQGAGFHLVKSTDPLESWPEFSDRS